MKNLLTSDHLELDAIFDELRASLANGDRDEIYRKLDYFWARLAMHIRAENLHVFPSILRIVRESDPHAVENDLKVTPQFVRETIGQLENDHSFFMRELAESIKQMRAMRDHNRRAESGELEILREKNSLLHARLKRHDELEETCVYIWAEKLAAAEAKDIRSKIEKELKKMPLRFR